MRGRFLVFWSWLVGSHLFSCGDSDHVFNTTSERRTELLLDLFKLTGDRSKKGGKQEAQIVFELYRHFQALESPTSKEGVAIGDESVPPEFQSVLFDYLEDKRTRHKGHPPRHVELKMDFMIPNAEFLAHRTGFVLNDADKIRVQTIQKPISLENELVRLGKEISPHEQHFDFLTEHCDDESCDLRPFLAECKQFPEDQKLLNVGHIFSAVGTFQGSACYRYSQHGSVTEPMSVQEVIDCHDEGNRHETERGGSYAQTADYLEEHSSIAKSSEYPYHGAVGVCRRDQGLTSAISSTINGRNFTMRVGVVRRMVPVEHAQGDAESMIRAWLRVFGPLHVRVNLDKISVAAWRFNDGELLNTCHNKPSSGQVHSLVLVGYGKKRKGDEIKRFWVVKNSWGQLWGREGYGFIRADNCDTSPFVDVVALPMIRVSAESPPDGGHPKSWDDGCTRRGLGYFGSAFQGYRDIPNAASCYQRCIKKAKCKTWSFLQTASGGMCELFQNETQSMGTSGLTSVMSGPRHCPDQIHDLPACAVLDRQAAGGTFQIHEKSWNPFLCQKLCQDEDKCTAWVLNLETGVCSLKDSEVGNQMESTPNVVSGPRSCPQKANTENSGETDEAADADDEESKVNTAAIIGGAAAGCAGLAAVAGGGAYYMTRKDDGVDDEDELLDNLLDDTLHEVANENEEVDGEIDIEEGPGFLASYQ